MRNCSETPMHRFAWLELDEGMWHLLTHLAAEPAASTRRWSDRQHALTELMEEGWTVVRPYPQELTMKGTGESVFGYGLTRTIH